MQLDRGGPERRRAGPAGGAPNPRGTARRRALLLCGWLVAVAACGAPPSRPNLVIVSADTLNRSALRVYDSSAAPLPHLDPFAAASLVFTQAYTPSSWTLPAHASLFTGRYPNRHGVTRVRQALPGTIPTLAEMLAEAGYRTLAFTDGALLEPSFGHSRGFQVYDDNRDPDVALPGPGGDRVRLQSAQLFDRALAFLHRRPGGDPPFFLFLHTYVVHDYFYRYTEAKPPPGTEPTTSYLGCLLGDRRCSEAEWALLRERYRAGVALFDEGFGALLQLLEDRDLAESTLVILLSDHGEGFEPTRGRIHHGGRLHEDQLRIPFLVRLPGAAPRIVPQPLSLVDVLPTLAELLATRSPAEIDGESLAPWFRGVRPPEERPLYAMEYAYVWADGRREYRPSSRPHSLAVIRGHDWFIQHPGSAEYYDMRADPRQRDDRAASQSGLEPLRDLAAAAAARSNPEAGPAPVGAALEEHLRALGYLP